MAACRVVPDAHRFVDQRGGRSAPPARCRAASSRRTASARSSTCRPSTASCRGCRPARLRRRAHAPRAVARSLPAVGRDVDRLALDLERAFPEAGLREAVAVEHHAPVRAHEVLRLLERGDRAGPREVERERVLGRLGDRRARGAAARSPRRGTARRSCPCGRRAPSTRAARAACRSSTRTRTRPASRGSGTGPCR